MKNIILIIVSLFLSFQSFGQTSKKISQEVELFAPYDSSVYWRIAKTGYNYKVNADEFAQWVADNYVTVPVTTPTEITRAQAATHDAANGGDGDWVDGAFYRITNPVTPLYTILLQATKDKDGNPRLSNRGIAYTSTTPSVQVQVGYDWSANTIQYISMPSQFNYLSGLSSYSTFDFNDPVAQNNIIRSSYYSFGGSCKYSNNLISGGSVVLVNSEISGSSVTSAGSVSLTGTSYTTSYMVNSRVRSSTVTLTGDSKIDQCDFQNITISGSGITLTSCTFIGNNESITFPAGYSATGKTFISGVSSNFTDSLDLSNGSIYDATGGGSGFGLLTIPANREWVGKFIFLNDYAVIEEITKLSTWIPEIIFQADIPSTFGGFTFNLLDIASGATVDKIVGTALTTDLGKASRSFDAYGAALNQAGFAVITRQGDLNIYLDGKSIPTF